MNQGTLTRTLSRVLDAAESLAVVAERRWRWLVVACSALYVAAIGSIAAGKPFENDELFTLYMSRLPTMDDVRAALLSGGEQLPPFFFLVTRVTLGLGSNPHLWLRLPAMAGVLVMCLCVFRFVSRRTTHLLGLVAMLLPLSMSAYYYAFEARPYGFVLGCAAVALVCWQSAAEADRRWVWLVGLSLSLAAAIASHYYAVLVLVPLGCGELVRTAQRRRLDVGVWLALIVALFPLAIFFPYIQRARAYSTGFWTTPSWGDMPDFFVWTMTSAALPVTAMLLASALATLACDVTRQGSAAASSQSGGTLTTSEVVTAAAFLLIPVIAVAAAMLVTGAYVHRYALPGLIGVTILVTIGLRPLFAVRPAVLLLALAVLEVGFLRRSAMTRNDSAMRVRKRDAVVALLRAQPERDLLIACADQHDFMVLSEYAPPDVRQRLAYLVDADVAMRRLHHNSLERGMVDLLGPWFHLNVQSYRSVTSSGQALLVLGRTTASSGISWLMPELLSAGRTVELRSMDAGSELYHVRSTAR